MQVSVEITQGLERRLTISVPAETVDVEVKNRLRQVSKTQRIDGFRPGKVPPSVIQKRYGKSVRQEVAGEIMQRNFVDAIVAEKINPAGRPSFVAKSNEDGKPLEFEATFEIYPEVVLKDLEKIVVERPDVEVNDSDLDEMFVTLQKQHQTWKENNRVTKKGDKLTLDFNGRVDGEDFEGGKAEGFELELGAGRMIPGFEQEITGMKAGEEKTIKVTFPDDYHAEGLLAGHEVGLPSALVAQEVDVLRQQAMQRFQGQMDPKNLPELPSEMFTEQAERRVKIGLLLGEVIKVNEIKVDNAKVDELIATAASAYEDPREVIEYYANNKELMQQMQNVALEEQAVEFLVEKADVSSKKASFQDIMNPEGK
jgi:trigger factor